MKRSEVVPVPALASASALPQMIAESGPRASRRFIEFFTAHIRNNNTREVYSLNINAFLAWRANVICSPKTRPN